MAVWRSTNCDVPTSGVPLADASVTEWREKAEDMQILDIIVPLADASVTEWRMGQQTKEAICRAVPLADASVTEWRRKFPMILSLANKCATR